MRNDRFFGRFMMVTVLGVVAAVCGLQAQTTTNSAWNYTLLPESTLLDDCPICDRLSAPVALRGNFQMRLLRTDALFSYYAV